MDKAYFLSSDIDLNVKIKIIEYVDERPQQKHEQRLDLLHAELATDKYGEARRLSGLIHASSGHREYYVTCQLFADNGTPISLPTQTKHTSFAKRVTWQEWVTLPIAYRDLPADAVAAITVWDVVGPRKVTAVGGTTVSLFGKARELRKGGKKLQLWPQMEADGRWSSATPCKIQSPNENDRLDKLDKRYQSGLMKHVEWLDKLAFTKIDQVKGRTAPSNDRVFLMVEFPRFELPVLFFERFCGTDLALRALRDERHRQSKLAEEAGAAEAPLMLVTDLASDQIENPVQKKHIIMSRSDRATALGERQLKPSKEELIQLQTIVQLPPTAKMNTNDEELLWKFRYFLSESNPLALLKFCRVVDWERPEELREAEELLSNWSRPRPADALELLTDVFQAMPIVRQYGISCLDQADDEELEIYLPQLVQALRYEKAFLDFEEGELEQFLVRRAESLFIGNFLAWNLRLERSNPFRLAPQYQKAYERFEQNMSHGGERQQQTWLELKRSFDMFDRFEAAFKEARKDGGRADKVKPHIRQLFTEGSFRDMQEFEPVILPMDPRIRIHGLIGSEINVFKSKTLPLGIKFKTRTKPEDSRLPIQEDPATGERTVQVMWKTGDDLRQDGLVCQMFALMDRLLKEENVDLKLMPYLIMATSYNDTGNGMMEMVTESADLADIFKDSSLETVSHEGGRDSINAYLRNFHPAADPDPMGPTFGVEEGVYETMVKSCAGYCVMTYLLAIGDRHLNNVMLRSSGHMFHIDFGFILGLDPKPLPPPMKLTKEMVRAMGGAESAAYRRFTTYCCEAFNILRKYAPLVINMHSLMKDASIPDFVKTGERGINVLLERFRLDMTDEDAVQHFQDLMDESVTSLMPKLTEVAHAWATYWR